MYAKEMQLNTNTEPDSYKKVASIISNKVVQNADYFPLRSLTFQSWHLKISNLQETLQGFFIYFFLVSVVANNYAKWLLLLSILSLRF